MYKHAHRNVRHQCTSVLQNPPAMHVGLETRPCKHRQCSLRMYTCLLSRASVHSQPRSRGGRGRVHSNSKKKTTHPYLVGTPLPPTTILLKGEKHIVTLQQIQAVPLLNHSASSMSLQRWLLLPRTRRPRRSGPWVILRAPLDPPRRGVRGEH